MAKKPFVKPQMHVIMLPDVPQGVDLASLSDEELLEVLRRNRYEEQRRCFMASENFIAREIAGQMVLVPVDGAPLNGMIAMTPTGAFLMEQLRERRTWADLAQALQSRYNIAQDTANADTRAFLDKAVRSGLVVAC